MVAANRNINGKFLPPDIAKDHFNLSRNLLMKIASEAGAVFKYGRTVRIDIEQLERYYRNNYPATNE